MAVVWPNTNELIDNDVKEALITWMGVTLSANGLAEAATQVGDVNARAKSKDSDQG